MSLSERDFYCVKCRKTVTLPASDIKVTVYKNARFAGGSPALVGECKCGTKVTKFIKHDDKEKLKSKYGEKKSSAAKSPKKSPKKMIDKKCLEKCVKKCTK
jgi:hypothetical protein